VFDEQTKMLFLIKKAVIIFRKMINFVENDEIPK
jgi:hypothetical protein